MFSGIPCRLVASVIRSLSDYGCGTGRNNDAHKKKMDWRLQSEFCRHITLLTDPLANYGLSHFIKQFTINVVSLVELFQF